MPSTTITSLLWPAGDNVSIKGEVFEAEATGTRYMLRGCKPSDTACEYQTAFVEFGPWASETLPADAAETGVYDVHGTVDGTVYSSVCDMSRSVIEKCTVSKQSGFGDSTTEYTTTRTKGEKGEDFTLLYHTVTLTGGLEKLASASTAVASTKATSTGEASSTNEASSTDETSSANESSSAADASATDKSSTQTEMETASSETTSTTETPIPTETASAGSPPLVRAFAALAVAGMAAALVV
ncbi:hypothetical protein CEP54_002736 [Fusarium duplospermum]|uniref:Uncharacterized protein n=1 Tax=Fusarium duplospermum TaxID=1325734 RepID=A0A428QTT2_9HYPO|nr:hypothetical protein CEP54_002736 [Fusarium duplospermum]